MKAMQLAAVWREATALGGPSLSDAELLRRQQTDPGDASFAALVQRYGRLVWLVCRQLTRCDADADDAFQAVFVVLLRNVGSIRQAGKLPAWLHGVAIKVCAKQRLSQLRRLKRESRHALPDAASTVVPPTKWDATLLAVQEEVANLPETLRVPFVLACLEGQSSGDAARALGWKLGTFTGRLSKAKDVLLARLEARGVLFSVAGLVAGVGLMVAPGAVLAKACLLVAVVPSSILPLTYGVVAMSLKPLKILALTFGVACGLGVVGWSQMPGPSANAQQGKAEVKPKPEPAKEKLDTIKQMLEAEAQQFELRTSMLKAEMKQLDAEAALLKPDARMTTTINERNFDKSTGNFIFEKVQAYSPTDFTKYLEKHAAEGHQFVSQVTLKNGDADTNYWVFRKAQTRTLTVQATSPPVADFRLTTEGSVYLPVQENKPVKLDPPLVMEVEQLRTQVESLKEQLAKSKKKPELKGHVTDTYMTTLTKEELSAAGTYVETINKLRFNDKLILDGVETSKGIQITSSGPKEACDWAKSILQPAPAEKPKK